MTSINPIAIALVVFACVVAVEVFLTARWNAAYMTTGLPIYIRRIERPAGLNDVDLDALQKSAATVAAAPFVFQRLAPNVIAFKEKAFAGSIHYFPLMRGVIRHANGEPTVVVLGLVKYWALALIAAFILIGGRHWWSGMQYIAIAFAVLYLIQAVRFGRVARALRPQPSS